MMKDLNSFPLAIWVEGKAVTVSSLQKGCALSGLLPGTLKYSWYKYCKALRLIKALVFINEVTEGSIDQAFCFMS